MPRLTLALAPLAALVLVARTARAADTASSPRWELDTRIGYGASWTTAQSYLGFGVGLAGGVTLRIPVHLGIGVTYHGGSLVSAGNGSIAYASRAWSLVGNATLGYDIALHAKRFILRPKVLAGCVLRSEATWIAGASRRDTTPLFAAGIGTDFLVRFAGLHAGIDARALVLPSEVAAPALAGYAVFGL